MSNSPLHKSSSLEKLPADYPDNGSTHELALPLAWHQKMRKIGVESRGIAPVPQDQRTDDRYFSLFWLWFAASFNLLPISTGSLATAHFGLSLRDASLVIIFFSIPCAIPPAYLITLGPKTGCRQIIQARFSFGKYGAILPALLNTATLMGFAILTCILGGQTLSSVGDGGISWNVGIVITALIGLVVAFFGSKVLHIFERYAWIPVLIAIVVALGTGGHHLQNQQIAEPATSRSVLTFASLIAGFLLTWSGVASDFAIYFRPEAPSKRIFWYTYLGLLLPTITLMILGAAMGGAITTSPTWILANAQGSVGGLLHEMLRPAKGFGDFLTVLIALSIVGNLAITFYAFAINVQICFPVLVKVPRYFFIGVATALVIPLSIIGATKFYESLLAFLGVIGYWAGALIPVLLEEHFIFRKGSIRNWNIEDWNNARRLPSGIPAVLAVVASFGLVTPCMDQIWYVGPIGSKGDLGFEAALGVTALLYPPLRYLEIRLSRRSQTV